MKKIFLFLLFAAILAVLFYFLKVYPDTKGSYIRRFGVGVKMGNEPYVEINNQKFSVEIADTPEKRSKGLGERKNLCPDCGMLFKFPEPGNYSFWMKGMKFPLDIIWIQGNEVVYIAGNISPEFKNAISPGVLADKVLEINGGLSERYEIKKGSEAVIRK